MTTTILIAIVSLIIGVVVGYYTGASKAFKFMTRFQEYCTEVQNNKENENC